MASEDELFRKELLSILPGAKSVTPNEVTLLGAGLSTYSSTIMLRNRLHKLCHSLNKLSKCEPHDAYWIVTRAAGSPKLTYLLRTSLCFNNSEALDTADNELSTALSKLLSIDLSGPGWRQAVLPVDMGGLNLPSTKSLALLCFLSSTSAASQMVATILSDRGAVVQGVDTALERWKAQIGMAALNTPASNSQRNWFKVLSQKRH